MKPSKDGLRGNRCICRTCGERFNSAAAFDAHRTGKHNIKAINYGRRCLLDFEMERKGMTRNEQGFWLTPRKNPRKPSKTPPRTPAYCATTGGIEGGRYEGTGSPIDPCGVPPAGVLRRLP